VEKKEGEGRAYEVKGAKCARDFLVDGQAILFIRLAKRSGKIDFSDSTSPIRGIAKFATAIKRFRSRRVLSSRRLIIDPPRRRIRERIRGGFDEAKAEIPAISPATQIPKFARRGGNFSHAKCGADFGAARNT